MTGFEALLMTGLGAAMGRISGLASTDEVEENSDMSEWSEYSYLAYWVGEGGSRVASASIRTRFPNAVAARPTPNGFRRPNGEGAGMLAGFLT
jgi:hypothetical protein